MSHASSSTAWGFLTVLSSDEQGLIGGYLVLNQAGRPLEFHCTAPVKAESGAADPVRSHARTLFIRRANRPNAGLESDRHAGCRLHRCAAGAGDARLCRHARGAGLADDSPAQVVWPRLQPPGSPGRASIAVARRPQPLSGRGDHLCRRRESSGRDRAAPRPTKKQSSVAGRSLEPFDLAEPFERIRDAIAEAQRQSRA